MNNQPKITVLMALFNAEKFVGKAIQSVLNQTCKNFEILVVDDASTDNGIDAVLSFNDPRIKIIRNDKNSGAAHSRNIGIQNINTEYIAILDLDDIFYPTKLEEQIRFLDSHPNFAAIGTWTEVIDSEGIKTGVVWKNKMTPENISLTLLFHNCISHSSALIRRVALDGKKYNSPDKDEDYDLWIQLEKNGNYGIYRKF